MLISKNVGTILPAASIRIIVPSLLPVLKDDVSIALEKNTVGTISTPRLDELFTGTTLIAALPEGASVSAGKDPTGHPLSPM